MKEIIVYENRFCKFRMENNMFRILFLFPNIVHFIILPNQCIYVVDTIDLDQALGSVTSHGAPDMTTYDHHTVHGAHHNTSSLHHNTMLPT